MDCRRFYEQTILSIFIVRVHIHGVQQSFFEKKETKYKHFSIWSMYLSRSVPTLLLIFWKFGSNWAGILVPIEIETCSRANYCFFSYAALQIREFLQKPCETPCILYRIYLPFSTTHSLPPKLFVSYNVLEQRSNCPIQTHPLDLNRAEFRLMLNALIDT